MKGLASTTLVNILAAFMGLLSGVILARLMEPSERGELAVIQN